MSIVRLYPLSTIIDNGSFGTLDIPAVREFPLCQEWEFDNISEIIWLSPTLIDTDEDGIDRGKESREGAEDYTLDIKTTNYEDFMNVRSRLRNIFIKAINDGTDDTYSEIRLSKGEFKYKRGVIMLRVRAICYMTGKVREVAG